MTFAWICLIMELFILYHKPLDTKPKSTKWDLFCSCLKALDHDLDHLWWAWELSLKKHTKSFPANYYGEKGLFAKKKKAQLEILINGAFCGKSYLVCCFIAEREQDLAGFPKTWKCEKMYRQL